ncbi:MAG TPA: DEAD/DEAH box helicase [Acidimicrobiales bacterium]|nr:DEAD/DEAH box helicase [Acidimicrobiales bacterium]
MEFSPATRAWFEASFEAPTEAQTRGWESIGRGDHTLILAPTGSGKTLAAFLWALDRLFTDGPGEGCRVLYVSPLKALTYDVARNLRAPLAGIRREAARIGIDLPELRIGTRTGDTSAEERRVMTRRPPDILITTPESLYLLLTSKAASILRSVEHVIVDEIHSVASTKRGSHLALSLERLEEITARPPQRIGLSATQRPLQELARFLGGGAPTPRPVSIVDAGVRKPLELSVVVPVEDMGDLSRPGSGSTPGAGAGAGAGPAADGAVPPDGQGSIWPAVYPELLSLIRSHRSTLIFVNSRRLAERLAARLNELAAQEDTYAAGGSAYLGAGAPAELVRAHHGSIAREQRLEIEDTLKAGTLPALVATSSLELGIDMGAIDLVVQVEAPTSVSSGLQRIGRAGHQVGEPSKGRIFPKFRHDLLVAAAVAERMQSGLVEETTVPRNALDVLAQQVVATVAAWSDAGPVPVEPLLAMVRRAYPYSDLPEEAFFGVLDMLSGRYPSDEYADLRPRVVWDRVAGTVEARPGARMLAVTSGGTIPDRGLYGVFTPEGGRVGELDEEMVYESRVGETFLLGATTWRIQEITRDRVIVVPAPGVPGKMPFWHGDSPGRPYELGAAIGEFTRTVADRTDEDLAASCGLDGRAVRNLRTYIDEERQATGGLVPTDRQIVVERFRDELGDWRVAVLSPFGARVHAPWALAIEARLRKESGVEVQALWSDDGIIVRLPEAEEAPPLESILIDPDQVEELVVSAVGGSALFAARFRENAARSLLLPRRRPGSRTPLWQLRQRAADLLAVASRHGSFPVLLETYRECLQDVFDLPALVRLLRDISSRRRHVAEVELADPSPFASGLVFAYVAAFMYEGDAPLAERRAQALTLDRRMLAELLGTDELRDLLDAGVIEDLEAEMQGLSPERQCTSVEQAADLLRRVGDLSITELELRCSSAELAALAWAALVSARRAVVLRVAGDDRLVLADDAARYRDGVGSVPPVGLPDALLEPVPDALLQLVRRWARTHGPFLVGAPAARFGVALAEMAAVLERLRADGRLLRGGFRPGGEGQDEWCDSDVLRLLRQRSLAALRREVEPTAAEALVRFVPAWHGIAALGAQPEATGADRVLEVVGQLEGLPLPASVLESDILPARVRDYEPRMLDELLVAGEVMWVGAGSLGRDDGRVVLVRRDVAGLVLPRLGLVPDGPGALNIAGSDSGDGAAGAFETEVHTHIRAQLSARGACFFRELGRVAWSDQEVLAALWDLVWAGEVTCDGFAAVRVTVGGGAGRRTGGRSRQGGGPLPRAHRPRPGSIRATAPPAGQGRWSLVIRELGGWAEVGGAPSPGGSVATGAGVAAGVDAGSDPGSAVGSAVGSAIGSGGAAQRRAGVEAAAAVAGALLERHGVLTRDAVRSEAIPGGFAGIYPVLKTLEESGRIRRGYFLAGMGGAQFALPGAVDRLRSEARRLPPVEGQEGGRGGRGPAEVMVLAATDPANPLGAALPWPVKGPQRVPGSYVVVVDGVASAYIERGGKGLVALRDVDGSWEEAVGSALASLVSSGRWRRLVLQRYPEELAGVLEGAGFIPSPKGLVRYA